MSPFQLSLPGFDGPVDALPSMVSARQLTLEEMPLAAIPAQFLEATRRQEQVDLEAAGEVLSAVSRLMLLKSIHLLAEPEDDPEDVSIGGSEDRRMPGLQEAAALLSAYQGRPAYSTPGDVDLVPRLTEPRSPVSLVNAWTHLRAREGRSIVRAAVPAFVRLEVAVSRLLSRLRTGTTVQLGTLLRGASRRDVVMHFLAVLELARAGQVAVRQDETFEEITLEWARPDAQQHIRAG